MGYLFPLRLHLSRGGHIDGTLGGVDPELGELLLVLPLDSFRVDVRLIDAVTPLGALPPAGSDLALAPSPALAGEERVEIRWRPTWRSHLGLLGSLVLPGFGQFIQEADRELGFLFLGGAALCVATGLLALYGPSSYARRARATTAGVFFGLAGSIALGSGVHAWHQGRERRSVRKLGAAGGRSTSPLPVRRRAGQRATRPRSQPDPT